MARHGTTRRRFLGATAAGAAVTTGGFVPYLPMTRGAFANQSVNLPPEYSYHQRNS
ncbi:MAG: twin-arginine translocation signal domain-containing protein [Planctomycetia bacterium]